MAGSRGLSPKAAPLGRPRAPAPVPRPFASSPPPSFSLSFSPLSASPFFFLLLSYFLRAPTALLFPRSEFFFFPFKRWRAERESERESERERGKKEGKKKKERKERKKEISSARGSVGPGTDAHPPGRLRAGRGGRGSRRRRRSGRRRRKGWAGAAGPGRNQWAGCARPRFVALSRRTKAAGRGERRGAPAPRRSRRRGKGRKKRRKKPASAFPKWVLPSLPSSPAPLPPSRSRGPMLATHPRASNK